MKQNLYNYVKTELDRILLFDPGFIIAENHYDENYPTRYLFIPWIEFKEIAERIDFEYASSLDIFHKFYVMDERMSVVHEFNEVISTTDPDYMGTVLIPGSRFWNMIPFDVYFANHTIKSFDRLLIKLLFKEYLVPSSINYRKDYFVWYKEGKRYLVFNLSNEAIRVKLGDGKETFLHYDTRPKESSMLQENQYIEAFARMLTKIAPKDMQIILYIGVCPLSGDNNYVMNAIRDRKALAYKLSLRYKNIKPIYDYREMDISKIEE